MNKVVTEAIAHYVERHIGEFHDKRLRGLDNLKLKDVLKRKNPCLFRAKNVLTSELRSNLQASQFKRRFGRIRTWQIVPRGTRPLNWRQHK